jgi:hypothetical protein
MIRVAIMRQLAVDGPNAGRYRIGVYDVSRDNLIRQTSPDRYEVLDTSDPERFRRVSEFETRGPNNAAIRLSRMMENYHATNLSDAETLDAMGVNRTPVKEDDVLQPMGIPNGFALTEGGRIEPRPGAESYVPWVHDKSQDPGPVRTKEEWDAFVKAEREEREGKAPAKPVKPSPKPSAGQATAAGRAAKEPAKPPQRPAVKPPSKPVKPAKKNQPPVPQAAMKKPAKPSSKPVGARAPTTKPTKRPAPSKKGDDDGPVECEWVTCAACGCEVCTADGCKLHPDGSELKSGEWACSYECWKALTFRADNETKYTIVHPSVHIKGPEQPDEPPLSVPRRKVVVPIPGVREAAGHLRRGWKLSVRNPKWESHRGWYDLGRTADRTQLDRLWKATASPSTAIILDAVGSGSNWEATSSSSTGSLWKTTGIWSIIVVRLWSDAPSSRSKTSRSVGVRRRRFDWDKSSWSWQATRRRRYSVSAR